MLSPVLHLAPLAFVTCLAFGPFGGCGAHHSGSFDDSSKNTPTTNTGPGPTTGGGGGSGPTNDVPVDGGGNGGSASDEAPKGNVPGPGSEGPSGGTPEPVTLLLIAGAAAGYGVQRLKRRTPSEPNQEA